LNISDPVTAADSEYGLCYMEDRGVSSL
jgi:hypothetical protein